MRVLVIIPAYNEQETIIDVIKELRTNQPEYDYVVINDCSVDHTEMLLQQHNSVYINLPVNLGIGGGVQTGYKYALHNGYDVAIQMDADGQHDSAYLDEIVQPVAEGCCDMCIGSRFLDEEGFKTTVIRRLGINLLSFLIRLLSGVHVRDVTSGFRACNRHLIRYYSEHYAQDYPEPEAIIAAVGEGYTIKEVPVRMHERQGGVSSINTLRAVYYMIKVTISVVLSHMFSSKKKRR